MPATSVVTPTVSMPVRPAGVRSKRESPLDLSVKTVRQSADSTAKDDTEATVYANYNKTASGTRTGVLPPLQLPSSMAYPTFDSRGGVRTAASNVTATSPKVDFLPNFAATQHHAYDTQQRSAVRTNTHQQLYSQQQNIAPLPHVGSFKKNSIPSSNNNVAQTYDHKQQSYYPQSHRTTNNTNPPAAGIIPPYTPASNNVYVGYESSKRAVESIPNYGTISRTDYSVPQGQTNSTTPVTVPSYTPQAIQGIAAGHKRVATSDIRLPASAKLPRYDSWRQSIDQQIEQRFHSYTSSRAQQDQQPAHLQHQINGNGKIT